MPLMRPEEYLVEYSDYWISAGFGLAFGGIYSIPSGGWSAYRKLMYDEPIDRKQTIGSAIGFSAGLSYDIITRFYNSRLPSYLHRGTLARGRGALAYYAMQAFGQTAKSAAVVSKSSLKVGASLGLRTHVAIAAAPVTYDLIESVVVGTQVGNSWSPKPWWIPLPMWIAFS